MLAGKKALLLDMNSTFMFGEDRFGATEDFSIYYAERGGSLPAAELNKIIRDVYAYLDIRYPDERYRHCFPSLAAALQVVARDLPPDDAGKIIETFAFHELGHIPPEYICALQQLHARFTLAAVVDIWSPKDAWLAYFERVGIAHLFSATSFSSDHGMVKPSARPFELVLHQLGLTRNEAVVIGDSVRRDLGGAKNAGIDCILVGGAEHEDALASCSTLLEVCSPT